MHRHLLFLAVASAIATPAHAQSAEAEALFAEGDRLMAANQIPEACVAFEGSNRIESRAGTLIRLGECREKLKQFASAWSAYKDAATRAKDPRKLAIARAKAMELEPRLSYLTINVPEEARIEGLEITRAGARVDPALLNRAVPVDGGQYVIAARAPAVEEWRTAVTVPAEGGHVNVEVPKFKQLSSLVSTPSSAPGAGGGVHAVLPPPRPFWTTRRKVSIGLGAGALVTTATGIVLGVKALAKRDDAYALCPDPALPCADAGAATSLSRSGNRLSIAADVAFGVGGACAIGAVVLWLVGSDEHRELAIAPHVSPGSTGLVVSGAF